MTDEDQPQEKQPMFGPGSVQPIIKTTDPLAIWSVSLAAGSVPFLCCCSIVSAPAIVGSIVCGILSLCRQRDEPGKWSGANLAIIGLVVSALNALVLIFFFGIAALGGFAQQMKEITVRPQPKSQTPSAAPIREERSIKDEPGAASHAK